MEATWNNTMDLTNVNERMYAVYAAERSSETCQSLAGADTESTIIPILPESKLSQNDVIYIRDVAELYGFVNIATDHEKQEKFSKAMYIMDELMSLSPEKFRQKMQEIERIVLELPDEEISVLDKLRRECDVIKIPHISSLCVSYGECLGEGSFAKVYKGSLKSGDDTKEVAVKKPYDPDHTRESVDEGGAREFLNEGKQMFDCDHTNIVKLHGLCLDVEASQHFNQQFRVALIMELCDQSLLKYINRMWIQNNQLDEREILLKARQIAEGLRYLADLGMVHRDVRADNILMDGELLKIGDFGLARKTRVYHSRSVYQRKDAGSYPRKWSPPEASRGTWYNEKSDVWMFAVVLVEMCTGGHEPTDENPCGERHKEPKGCPTRLYKLIRKCWDYECSARPRFGEILDIMTNWMAFPTQPVPETTSYEEFELR